jgi:hypothetical protein
VGQPGFGWRRRHHGRCYGQHGRRHPRAGILRAARVFSDSDDFEIPFFEFFIERLPAWQVKVAASPRGPGDEKDLLAPKVREGM